MIILKSGNKLNPVAFSCSSCNCQYTANKNEYLVENVVMVGDNSIAHKVECCCPECGHVNVKIVYVY